MSQIKLAQPKRSRALWPVMGLLLAVALGVIAYIVAPDVISLTRRLLPGFRTGGIAAQHLRLAFTALTFVVFMGIAAMIVAIFSPKKALNVKETDLKKERADMISYKRNDRMRQRKINLDTKKYLKEKNKRGE